MGLGYTLFGKPVLTCVTALAALSAVYLVPEYWPDHAIARLAITRGDTAALRLYLARGLDPDDRSQWRSYLRRALGRTAPVGVSGSTPDLGRAEESLVSYSLGTCAGDAALTLVEAGADVSSRDAGQWTSLGRAASCGLTQVASAMLARGADPMATEPDGGSVLWERTTLGWRRRRFDSALVALLERAGATSPEAEAWR